VYGLISVMSFQYNVNRSFCEKKCRRLP